MTKEKVLSDIIKSYLNQCQTSVVEAEAYIDDVCEKIVNQEYDEEEAQRKISGVKSALDLLGKAEGIINYLKSRSVK